MMGCNSESDENCNEDSSEEPYHEVNVPDFDIDITEVTVGQYRTCVDNGSCERLTDTSTNCNYRYSDREEHPVNCINWNRAKNYCERNNKKLCSEAEWEKAARGTDERVYPWGDEESTCDRAVMNEGVAGCGENRTWPASSKPAGINGLYDMAGNVSEWVEDDRHNDYTGAPADGSAWVEIQRPSSGISRGGSFKHSTGWLRASYRDFKNITERSDGLGFRCCRDMP